MNKKNKQDQEKILTKQDFFQFATYFLLISIVLLFIYPLINTRSFFNVGELLIIINWFVIVFAYLFFVFILGLIIFICLKTFKEVIEDLFKKKKS